MDIKLHTFPIDKETPKGYWINADLERKWVSKTSRKRFAYDTKAGALENLRHRCAARRRFLSRDLDTVEHVIQTSDETLLKMEETKDLSQVMESFWLPSGKLSHKELQRK